MNRYHEPLKKSPRVGRLLLLSMHFFIVRRNLMLKKVNMKNMFYL